MYATKNEILIIQLWNAIRNKVTSLYIALLRKSMCLFYFIYFQLMLIWNIM